MKKRGLIFFCVLCTIGCLLQSCTVGQMEATVLLERLLSSQKNAPVGRSYLLLASPESDEYADAELLSQLFGKEGILPAALKLPQQGAFFLSVSCPFEIMVFQCNSRNDAKKVAKLCLERQNALCSFWQEAKEDLPPSGVAVRGCWVLFYLCPEEKACLDTFKRNV